MKLEQYHVNGASNNWQALISLFQSICGNITFDERRTKSKLVDRRPARFLMQIWDFVMVQGIFMFRKYSGRDWSQYGHTIEIHGD